MIGRIYGIRPWEMPRVRQGELKAIYKDLEQGDGED